MDVTDLTRPPLCVCARASKRMFVRDCVCVGAQHRKTGAGDRSQISAPCQTVFTRNKSSLDLRVPDIGM